MRWGELEHGIERAKPVLVLAAGMVVLAFLVAIWWQYVPPTLSLMLLSGLIGLALGGVCGLLAGGLCAMSHTSELIQEGINEIDRAYQRGRRDGLEEASEWRRLHEERIGA